LFAPVIRNSYPFIPEREYATVRATRFSVVSLLIWVVDSLPAKRDIVPGGALVGGVLFLAHQDEPEFYR
jgi:hypothetical protein